MSPFKIAALAIAATALGSASAEAQWYSSVQPAPQPLYPYAQPGRSASQPYAVEVAPGAYVIHRPGEARAPSARRAHRAAPAPQVKPSRSKNDPALIEELRQRAAGKPATVVNTTKVVYMKPKVVETKRYVDLPPRVVERYTVVDDSSGDKKVVVEAPPVDTHATKNDKPGKGDKRVIQADAEITILGPDRMTIQLYRKGERGKNARLN
ncbi:hypothetical protein [Undibacter mobilis]|nr:hypothetical protein [Undibacter mobilis]